MIGAYARRGRTSVRSRRSLVAYLALTCTANRRLCAHVQVFLPHERRTLPAAREPDRSAAGDAEDARGTSKETHQENTKLPGFGAGKEIGPEDWAFMAAAADKLRKAFGMQPEGGRISHGDACDRPATARRHQVGWLYPLRAAPEVM